MKDLTIIIQGRCEDEQLNLWFKNYSNYKVVISTWSDYVIPFEIPSNWKVIKVDGVDFDFVAKGCMQNLEYQITSTLNGLSLVDTKYAIKVRGDEYISSIEKIYEKIKLDEEKIVCSSIWFRAPSGPYPFHISDHIIAGTTDNLKLMFGGTKENLINDTRDNNTPESNLGMAYVQKKENYSIEDMFTICREINWTKYMKKWYDIIDVNELKPYILTYKAYPNDKNPNIVNGRFYYRDNFDNSGSITKF